MKWPVGSSRGKHRAAHTPVSELETSAYDSGQHLGQQGNTWATPRTSWKAEYSEHRVCSRFSHRQTLEFAHSIGFQVCRYGAGIQK